MKVICKARRAGKTTDIIKACKEYGGYIVCRNHEECYRVAKVAQEIGVNIPFPMSYDEFLNGLYYIPGTKCLHIDDIDMLLQQISKVPIHTVSITCFQEGGPGSELSRHKRDK